MYSAANRLKLGFGMVLINPKYTDSANYRLLLKFASRIPS